MVEKSLIINALLTAKSLHLVRGQGETARVILDGSATFHLSAGDCVHLNGLSGIGKTTLLWALAGLYPLHAGQLTCCGQTMREMGIAAWRANIALLPQKPVIFAGSVQDNLLYPFQNIAIQKSRAQSFSRPALPNLLTELQQIGLEDIPLERHAEQLSGGQQARLALVRALLTRPRVLLADEPTASLDTAASAWVWQQLAQFCQQGGAVLFTSHIVTTSMPLQTLDLNNATLRQFSRDES
jgi:ABC-type transport system involved in cytochrome bd biosynthesis fused ATPase/permease subunit